MATYLGMVFYVISSLSNRSLGKRVENLLKIPEYLIIAYSFMVGYAVKKDEYLSMRRDAADFSHRNRYVNKTPF